MQTRRASGRLQPRQVAKILLSRIDVDLVTCTELQSLWAGYGHICEVTATSKISKGSQRLILKLISPPKGADDDEGHLRKMLSYEVETYFYVNVAPRLSDNVAVAQCLAHTSSVDEELPGITAMILTDLRPEFPIAGGKRMSLEEKQVVTALEWLARFHAQSRSFLDKNLDHYVLPPLEESKRRARGNAGSKLWLNGGYTYLATRQSELSDLARDHSSEWSNVFCRPEGSSIAELAAAVLTPRGRLEESYIHGDVKSENLFTTRDGARVAFFDFQYVGLGLGVCDLAKLFTCSVPLAMLASHIPDKMAMGDGEKRLLQRYHSIAWPGGTYDWETFMRHWETALVDWCRFQASWGFWGNTEWLEARVRYILADDQWRAWARSDSHLTI